MISGDIAFMMLNVKNIPGIQALRNQSESIAGI